MSNTQTNDRKYITVSQLAANMAIDDLNLPEDLDDQVSARVVSVLEARDVVLKEHGTTNKEYQSKILTYSQQIKANVERYSGDVEWFKIDAKRKRGNILIDVELYEDIDKEMTVSNVTEMAEMFDKDEAASLIQTIAEGQGAEIDIDQLLSMFSR